jgi:glutamyl-tRNA synthetase
LGFPIFPLNWTDPNTGEQAKGFKETGYLPEALINFLAFLGWNPGTTQEIFSMKELIDAFSIERIGKAGAKFDIHKAQWFNQQYLKNKSDAELATFLLNALKHENISCTQEKAEKICHIMKERITFPDEFWTHGKFFFLAPTQFDESVTSKKWNQDAVKVLSSFAQEIKSISNLTADVAKAKLEEVTAQLGIGSGKIMQALRMSITGGASGPDLMMTMEIIGSAETASRIDFAIKNIPVKNP